MVTETDHPHIVQNSEILSGEPVIRGTRTPVRAIVEMWRLGIPVEEIPNRLPYLKLGQVFGALSYFSDHQAEIMHHIERNRVDESLIHPAAKNQSE